MADGWGPSAADGILGAVFGGVAYSVTSLWAQLHTGPPGADGTANIAPEAARVDVSTAFGTPSGGQVSNTAELGPWSATGAATYTHVSFWTASTGGTFVCSGTVTGTLTSVVSGDSFTVPVGGCTATMPLAS